MKKILAITLSLVMLFSLCLNASAALEYYTPESAGPTLYNLELTKPLTTSGAQPAGKNLVMNAGGSANFDIYFNLDVEDIELYYQDAAAGTVTVTTENNSYELAIDPQLNNITIPASERKGSHNVTVSSTGAITITSLAFHKAKNEGIGPYNNIFVEYNDYDDAMQTAVVVNPERNALKVNGAMRYYDYTSTNLVPKNIDGRIYLPIHAFARAFQLYYEDYPDLNYAYIANDNTVVYQRDDDTYMLKNDAKYDYGKFAIYLDGITWVPFRQMAELFGETVVWRDGYAVADDRIRANNIINNADIFNALLKDFAQFDVSNPSKTARNNTYYVSQAAYASDTNNGSENFPFRTIQKAADVAMAGDTVIIREGVYRETVTIKNDGTATQPVIFKAAEGENVTISAFEKVKGFTSYKGNIYQAIIPKSMGYDRNFVIMNDEILREGRYPDTDTSTVNAPHPGYTWEDNIMRATYGDIRMPVEQNTSKDYSYAIGGDLTQTEKDYWKGGTFVTLTGEAWTLCYAMITGSKYGRIDITHNGQGGYAIDNYYLDKKENDWGYITHHLNTVNLPGEWYVDDASHVLYLVPPEGADPATLEVEVKQRQLVVDMTDRKFVQFHNINTRGGGLTMAGNTEMDILDGGSHKYISQIDWSAAHATHDGRYIDRNARWEAKVDAPELGEVGFYAYGTNNAFVNTHIAYSAVAGIYLTGTYGYVENNFIESASYMGTYPGAITLEGLHTSDVHDKIGGHTVVANTCVGSGRANLYLSRGKAYQSTDDMLPYIACDLSFNRLQMGSTVARDTGNFYTFGTSVGNDVIHTHLHHNVVYDIGTETKNSALNALIYHDGYSSFYDTYSNLTFQTVPGYVTNDIFQHLSGDYKNYVEKWGNVSAGTVPQGMAGLKISDYPYGKKFDVGSTLDGHERVMENYNKVNEATLDYTRDAELANGAVLADDGLIDMPTADASATYKNVTCYPEGTELSVYYSSDIHQYSSKNVPTMTFEFIQNGQVVATRTEGVYAHAVRLTDRERTVLYLNSDMSGTYDVRVKVNKDYVRLSKLVYNPINYAEKAASSDYPLDGDTITLGSWDHCLDCNDAGPRTNIKTEGANVIAKTNFTIHDTNEHKPVYENRIFANDASVVTMRVGCAHDYANGYIDIYIDSMSSGPVATFDILSYFKPHSSWEFKNMTAKMNRVVPAGVHTVYIVYRGYKHPTSDVNDAPFGITDSHWISFHNGETYTKTTPTVAEADAAAAQ